MVSKPDASESLGRLIYTTIIYVILLIAIEDEQEKLGMKGFLHRGRSFKNWYFPPPCGELQIFCEFQEFPRGQGGGGQVIL